MTSVVIGSGPAGVAAAMALLDRGQRVLMIDGGTNFAPSDPALMHRLAAADPGGWSDADRSSWSQGQFSTPPGQTRRYGSDAGMEPPDATFGDTGHIALRASRAQGGLSNLWGAAILPYRQQDIADWPVTADDLAPHYRAVAAFVPVSGTAAFDALFPALTFEGRTGIAPSVQATEILRRLRASDPLRTEARPAWVGEARQAVSQDCRQCGLCLHGCPYQLIWSARRTLAELQKREGFSYRSGPAVRRIEPGPDFVTIHLEGGEQIRAERAYLGAGVLETARILMASGLAQSLTLQDSQQALLPFLHRWSAPRRPDRPPFTTLPQLFVELDDPRVSPHLVHSQIYTWNDHFPRDLVLNYGRIPGTAPLLRALARRLIVAQVFLHSRHSARIALRLSADGRLIADSQTDPATVGVMDRAIKGVARALRPAGLTALAFARRLGAPGSSFHVGGSLPMAAAPTAAQSDTLGRPGGVPRLHVIDASVFPSIPATTITLSVMANAHRIASQVP